MGQRGAAGDSEEQLEAVKRRLWDWKEVALVVLGLGLFYLVVAGFSWFAETFS